MKMKTQKIAKISYYSLVFGWFPFMWLCAFASHSSIELRIFIIFLGLFLCLVGSIYLTRIFNNDELFKSIDKLNEEKQFYRDATERLDKKIKEL